MPRDDFSQIVKDQLAKRTGYKCSCPVCRKTTIGPQQGSDGSVNVGEAAHICAAAPGGKRYDKNMTSEERKSYDNGIWLCRNHAALIDRDEKYFTIEMLRKWKEDAERKAGEELIGIDEIKHCKFRVNLFYRDLEECLKGIEFLKEYPGMINGVSSFPIQSNWEEHIESISDLIGSELSTNLYNIIREIASFREEIEKIHEICNGKIMANNDTLMFNRRKRLFLERTDEWITKDFMDALKLFVEG